MLMYGNIAICAWLNTATVGLRNVLEQILGIQHIQIIQDGLVLPG